MLNLCFDRRTDQLVGPLQMAALYEAAVVFFYGPANL